jgi:hypothetical protein
MEGSIGNAAEGTALPHVKNRGKRSFAQLVTA